MKKETKKMVKEVTKIEKTKKTMKKQRKNKRETKETRQVHWEGGYSNNGFVQKQGVTTSLFLGSCDSIIFLRSST